LNLKYSDDLPNECYIDIVRLNMVYNSYLLFIISFKISCLSSYLDIFNNHIGRNSNPYRISFRWNNSNQKKIFIN